MMVRPVRMRVLQLTCINQKIHPLVDCPSFLIEIQLFLLSCMPNYKDLIVWRCLPTPAHFSIPGSITLYGVILCEIHSLGKSYTSAQHMKFLIVVSHKCATLMKMPISPTRSYFIRNSFWVLFFLIFLTLLWINFALPILNLVNLWIVPPNWCITHHSTG